MTCNDMYVMTYMYTTTSVLIRPDTVFPEMRAQLRTYHSIPALQAHQDPNAYKQLQDAPRLKSILKGATEDEPQPATMDEIKAASKPRTNPVNLIFVMSQYAPKISELHFPPPRDFFDLVMRPSLGSASRAKAFLWLIWWYLESDFTKEDSLRNPFGPGEYDSDDPAADAVPGRVPALKNLTEEQTAEENVDTAEEVMFGEIKRKERISILASEPSPAMTALKRARKEKGLTTGHAGGHASDDDGSEMGGYPSAHRPVPPSIKNLQHDTGSEYTRSPSPAAGRGFQAVNIHQPKPDMRINHLLNTEQGIPDQESPSVGMASAPPAQPSVKKGPGRGNWRRNKTKVEAGAVLTSTPSGSRIVQENHHVPLLPNTAGQHNFPATPASEYHDSSFPLFSNNNKNNPISPSQPVPSYQTGQSTVVAGMTHIPTPSYQAQKRGRGVTQHQTAIMSHRKQQIDYVLSSRIRKAQNRYRRQRGRESAVIRCWKRVRGLEVGYDSAEEEIRGRKTKLQKDDQGDGGGGELGTGCLYAGFFTERGMTGDLGEEVGGLARALRRVSRRLERWGEAGAPGDAVLRRAEWEAKGGGRRRREVFEEEDESDGEVDGITMMIMPQRIATKPKRVRKRAKPAGVKVEESREEGGTHPEQSMNGGGGDEGEVRELDEEDREMLGEVDVDESDEDEVDGDGEGEGEGSDVDMMMDD